MAYPRPFVAGILKDMKDPGRRYKLYANREVEVGRDLLQRAYEGRYSIGTSIDTYTYHRKT